MEPIVIVGTDTNIGKTMCSALLMSALEGTYFKPVQSGSREDNDTKTVKELSGLSEEHFLNEKYLLTEPLSPHRAAELDNVVVEEALLTLPQNVKFNPLIVELAGGLMVPINRHTLFIDVVKKWNEKLGAKVILCARTSLGTINHALLSAEALASRDIDLAGIVFIGEDDEDNRKTTLQFSKSRELGYIPRLEKINKEVLIKTFNENFDTEYFKGNYD